MKSKLIITIAVSAFIMNQGISLAMEGHEHHGTEHVMEDGSIMKDKEMIADDAKAVEGKVEEVGNKICPVSGEKVGEMGEIITYEYNGKIYNLCCKACAKDFKNDPEKYSKIAEDEVIKEKEENRDPHLDHNHNNS